MGSDSSPPQSASDLNAAEQDLVAAAAAGLQCDLSSRTAKKRIVRATILRALALGSHPDWRCDPHGVDLVGATVQGELLLAASQISVPIRLSGCTLDARVSVAGARTQGLELSSCTVPSIDITRAVVDGDLALFSSVVAGGISLARTQVKGG